MPILVVDDERDIRFVLSELLADEGYAVISVCNGHEALTYLHTTLALPCVILLDLLMPIMNGWDFLRARQHDPLVRAIPVVVLSATPNARVAATALGAQAVLAKPIDLEALVGRVHACCTPASRVPAASGGGAGGSADA